jgi:hypothetical protein
MAFVNINVREQKLEQYDFSLLKKITRGRTNSLSDNLILDSERDIWLLQAYTLRSGDPREGFCEYVCDYWGFYWKRSFFALETFQSNWKYDEKGHFHCHIKINVLSTSQALNDDKPLDCFSEEEKADLLSFPKALEPQKLEILTDLKAALEGYSNGNTLFKKPDCTVELEFQAVTL